MPVFLSPEVAAVHALHPYLGSTEFTDLPIRDRIAWQAETLAGAVAKGDRRVAMHVLSWWPDARDRDLDAVLAMEFGLNEARLTMAREYGYADWASVDALGGARVNPVFEAALDAMLGGIVKRFETMLNAEPTLARMRASYGHAAGLLHYLAANGVESHRQMVPYTAPEMADCLVRAGASRRAEAMIYGSGQSAYALAKTSAHPRRAGVAEALEDAMKPV
ncbi:MAG: hypothetical protein ACWA47_00440 [Brevirhabdus sp.]